MIEPNTQVPPGTPTIKLVGKDWPIPTLAIRQNRRVVPLLMSVMPMLDRLRAMREAAKAESPAADTMPSLPISEQEFEACVQAVFWSLTRAHPNLTFSMFEDWEVSVLDLMGALPTIMQQTGIFKEAKLGKPGPLAGQSTEAPTT